MGNHKSAQKRARQSIRKNNVNKEVIGRLRTSIKQFYKILDNKDGDNAKSASKILSLCNSNLSKAVKRGIITKKYASRKLSSLSSQLKK